MPNPWEREVEQRRQILSARRSLFEKTVLGETRELVLPEVPGYGFDMLVATAVLGFRLKPALSLSKELEDYTILERKGREEDFEEFIESSDVLDQTVRFSISSALESGHYATRGPAFGLPRSSAEKGLAHGIRDTLTEALDPKSTAGHIWQEEVRRLSDQDSPLEIAGAVVRTFWEAKEPLPEVTTYPAVARHVRKAFRAYQRDVDEEEEQFRNWFSE